MNEFVAWLKRVFFDKYEVIFVSPSGAEMDCVFTYRSRAKAEAQAAHLTRLHRSMYSRGTEIEYVVRKVQ